MHDNPLPVVQVKVLVRVPPGLQDAVHLLQGDKYDPEKD